LREENIIEEDEFLTHTMEEASFNDTIGEIEDVVDLSCPHDQRVILVNSINMYVVIDEYHRGNLMKLVGVNTKYKTVDRKIKPLAVPLPEESWQKTKEAANDPSLRNRKTIGHVFTQKTKEKLRVGREDFLLPEEERMFRRMLEGHGKAFAFSPQEIGCADPGMVEPMVIFTVPHVPWNLKPIPVPRAHLPKLIELLKEKVEMGILEPSNAPYSNRWFTVPKKNGSLRFIQDLQPVNKVTIQNAGIGPSVDEFAEAFAGRSIYSIGDLYSGYDQFLLAVDSRDITTM
jgi:hypothetical protein